jgi:hypothetical protein
VRVCLPLSTATAALNTAAVDVLSLPMAIRRALDSADGDGRRRGIAVVVPGRGQELVRHRAMESAIVVVAGVHGRRWTGRGEVLVARSGTLRGIVVDSATTRMRGRRNGAGNGASSVGAEGGIGTWRCPGVGYASEGAVFVFRGVHSTGFEFTASDELLRKGLPIWAWTRHPSLILILHLTAMAEPTKHETEQVFRVLKAQKANKVRRFPSDTLSADQSEEFARNSHALTATHGTRPGRASLSGCTSASSARVCTETWACISALCGASTPAQPSSRLSAKFVTDQPIWTVGSLPSCAR